MLNKAQHKTRLTQNNKTKQTSNANKNKKGRERDHVFNNPLCRIDSGSKSIQDSVILIVGIILRLGVT